MKAGEDCICCRCQLDKPPMPFSMAYWLRGIHRLGQAEKARNDFSQSPSYNEGALELKHGQYDLKDVDGGILLAHGWIALTHLYQSDATGQQGAGEFS